MKKSSTKSENHLRPKAEKILKAREQLSGVQSGEMSPESIRELKLQNMELRLQISQMMQTKGHLAENRFRALVENIHEMVTIIDPLGKVIYSSPAVEKITGFTLSELQEKEGFSLIHPDEMAETLLSMDFLLRNPGVPVNRTNRLLHKDGRWIMAEGVAINLLNDPNVNALITNYRDITGRVEDEKALKDNERKFRKIYENGPFGMALVNPDFSFQIEFDLYNVRKLIAGEIPVYKTEKRYIRKDGQQCWGSLTVTANFDENGKFLNNIAIIEDITHRKQGEEALHKATERLKLATRVSNIGIWDWDIKKNELYPA